MINPMGSASSGLESHHAGSARAKPPVRVAVVLLLALSGFAVTGAALWAQQIQFGGLSTVGPANSSAPADAARKGHVSLISDQARLQADTPQVINLEFRVDPGFHINSHTPKDEFLIPTALRLDTGALKLLSESYPQGSAFRLSLPDAHSPSETLDVYQGDFRVELRLIAPKGASTLIGSLRYQACDNAACFPARTLPVKIALTAR